MRTGFSGTPSSLLPQELQPCHFEVASEGKIVATLCDPKLCKHTIYPKLNKSWDVEGLLKEIANGPFHALIDTGALITGFTNYEVAGKLLEIGLQGMRYACLRTSNRTVTDNVGCSKNAHDVCLRAGAAYT